MFYFKLRDIKNSLVLCHILKLGKVMLNSREAIQILWNSISHLVNFFAQNYKEWLESYSKVKFVSLFGLPWQIIFIYAIRSIWLQRNQKVLHNTALATPTFKNQIISKVAEYWYSISSPSNSSGPALLTFKLGKI